MLRLFVLLFVTQNTIHQKFIKCIIKNVVFVLLRGFSMRVKMSFIVLGIWSFGFGKVWKSYGKISKGVRTNPILGDRSLH